jgi:putative hemolysin
MLWSSGPIQDVGAASVCILLYLWWAFNKVTHPLRYGATATFLPARRSLRIDAVAALRAFALVDREVIGSRRALALASDPGRFLSTVQIGITLVGVLSGAFSGATLGLRLAEWFANVGLPSGIAEAVGVGLVVAVITYFSLVIGELVPKQIALRNPEKIAVRVAPAMTAIAKIASPVVLLLDISGRALTWWMS